MNGMTHIYCGDGKGKTTAAAGLAIRFAGNGRKVLFVQFFKDGTSGECRILRETEGVQMICCPRYRGRFKNMTDGERKQATQEQTELLRSAIVLAEKQDLLVLDEILSAYMHETIPRIELTEFLKNKPEHLELVLTGRNPALEIVQFADYLTEMKKIKHPFDNGVPAREGAEF